MKPCTPARDFPRVFYLMYYMYRQYFPLLALTTYAKASAASQEEQLRVAAETSVAIAKSGSRLLAKTSEKLWLRASLRL